MSIRQSPWKRLKSRNIGRPYLRLSHTDCKKKVVADQQERLRPAASEVRALLADCNQFGERTGWRSKVTLRQGLSRTIEWWQNRLQRGVVRREHAYMT